MKDHWGYENEDKPDIVAVVRCRDCRFYEIWQMKSGKDGYTDDRRYKPSVCTVGRYAVHRDEDWFCADGERKTE